MPRAPGMPGDRAEQGGGGRALAADRGGVGDAQVAAAAEFQVPVPRRHVDAAGLGPLALAGQGDRQPDDPVQPGGEALHEGGTHVLDDEDRKGKARRQRRR